jgi:hypothetical protein
MQDIGCDVRKLGPHLSARRRQDPDEAQWVGVTPLSPGQAAGA